MVKKRKEDFGNYMTGVLQNSMLTGVPQIAAAGNLPKKIIRALVFVVCVGGFIYQSLSFMKMYWEYQTVVDVKVLSPTETHRPAVTLCTYNGVMLSKLCNDPVAEKYDLKCHQLENTDKINWCDCLPRFCEDGKLKNFSELSLSDYSRISTLPTKVIQRWMPTVDDFSYCLEGKVTPEQMELDYCSPDTHYVEIRCPNDNPYPEYCFSTHTLIGKPDAVPEKVMSDGKMVFETNHLVQEAPSTMAKTLTYVAFHSPYHILNPIAEGFRLDPDTTYYFHMKKMVKKLLPPPYETNCFDYIKQWKARGGIGPVTMMDCIQECRKNLSISRHGCVLKSLQMPGNELRCPHEIVDSALIADSKECADENCKPACDEETYIADREVSFQKMSVECVMEDAEILSRLDIYMNGMETTIYSYSPKFHDIETFSYLGGYVGMWLGISLVALFDFIETMVVMMKYPIRRYMAFRAKRERIKAMRRSRKI